MSCFQGDSDMFCVFFFSYPAPTELYTLSLHDALPILPGILRTTLATIPADIPYLSADPELVQKWRKDLDRFARSEEHTSELQSRRDLVCRLLLEKKKERLELNTYHNYRQPQHGMAPAC